jgi:hypothetical protein
MAFVAKGAGCKNNLIDGAVIDAKLVRILEEKGDDLSNFRDVTFLFLCPSKDKADQVSGFLVDYHFADAKLVESNGEFTVEANICMPIQQQIVTSVSGLMTVVGLMFDSVFDGWNCKVSSK